LRNTDTLSAEDTAAWLMTPEAIRTQCGALFALAEQDRLAHFRLDLSRLDAAVDEVVATIRANYPDLKVPPHARWRHFVLGGQDRWAPVITALDVTAADRARLECELAILSVLLDAGAGPDWSYRDPATGEIYARSEGLALASLDMFAAGAFNARPVPGASTRVLKGFSPADLVVGFQVSDTNPLEGLEGRAGLIAALGRAVAAREDIFGEVPRLGHIADHLFALADEDGRLPARSILVTLLDVLGPIWPDTPVLDGQSLGDCWPHPDAPGPGLVPFHKLSQWLSYSLIEPLERAGVTVTGLDALTGLPEYRNGGLFLDTGVLSLRDPTAATVAHEPSSPLIVEWRALTVCLLDRVATGVRERLRLSPDALPLAAVLEGGTWATGRRLARDARPGGTPPLTISSTGTVF